jgi:lambda repressor-like predicted transcriptional regulator
VVNREVPENTLRPLPIRLRPDRDETVESYVRRLARANYLRPSHLRRFLSHPASHYTAVKPDRLAIVTGRSREALEHALIGLTKSTRGRREPIKPLTTRHVHRQADKPELFAAIRYAARREGLSIRALEARFHVHRRTIRQALASPIPPPRKKINRQPYARPGRDRWAHRRHARQPARHPGRARLGAPDRRPRRQRLLRQRPRLRRQTPPPADQEPGKLD